MYGIKSTCVYRSDDIIHLRNLLQSIRKLSFFQGLNLDSEEDDDSDDAEEEDDDEEDEDDDEEDGPTRDELEQTAEGEFNLSGDEDVETGIVKFRY